METNLPIKFLDTLKKINKSCDFARWDGKIRLTNGLIWKAVLVVLKCQSLSSKWCTFLHDCIPKQQLSTSKVTVFIAFREMQSFYMNGNYNIQWLLLISLTPVYQEVTILFPSTHRMETLLYSPTFYPIFQFCMQVKFATLDGNIANDKQ